MNNAEFDEEKIKKILAAVNGGQKPFLDVEDIQDVYDYSIENGDDEAADTISLYAMQLYPESNDIILLRVNTLIHMNKFKEAEKLLDFVREQDCNDPDLYVNMGWLALRKKNLDRAKTFFDKAIEVCDEADYPSLNLDIGTGLNAFHFYEMALPFLNRYIEVEPHDDNALFERAYALDKLGRVEESIAAYNALLKVNPFDEGSWYNLGILYTPYDEEKAIEAYNRAISINVEYAEAYFNLGNIYISRDDFYTAIDCYTDYISLAPPKGLQNHAFQYLGECWNSLNRYDIGVRCYKIATEMGPRNADAWYGLTISYIELKKPEPALKTINKAIKLDPKIAEYYFTRSQVNSMLGASEMDTLVDIAMGLKCQPNNIFAWSEMMKSTVLRTIDDDMDAYDPMGFVSRMRANFEGVVALDLVEAFLTYYNFKAKRKNMKKILSLVENVAKQQPEIIYDAAQDGLFSRFVTKEEFEPILKKYDIEL